MSDVVGRLFREFAVTLATTIVDPAVRVVDADCVAVRVFGRASRTRGTSAARRTRLRARRQLA
jgi:hypothetical protein